MTIDQAKQSYVAACLSEQEARRQLTDISQKQDAASNAVVYLGGEAEAAKSRANQALVDFLADAATEEELAVARNDAEVACRRHSEALSLAEDLGKEFERRSLAIINAASTTSKAISVFWQVVFEQHRRSMIEENKKAVAVACLLAKKTGPVGFYYQVTPQSVAGDMYKEIIVTPQEERALQSELQGLYGVPLQ